MGSPANEIKVFSNNLMINSNYFIFPLGLISNFFCIAIFSKHKVYRGNRCSFYLIVESLFNIAFLIFYFFSQYSTISSGVDPGAQSLIWCKIRTTIGQPLRLTVGWIVCFEALDQFLSTYPLFLRQQISTLTLAKIFIFSAFIISTVQTIPYIFFYEIIPPYGCVLTDFHMNQYYSLFYYPVLHGMLPMSLSAFFSLLAYRNVRRLVRLQIPIERRQLDRQFTAMVFSRVICFICFICPYTVFRIYQLNVDLRKFDALSLAINQLFSVIVAILLGLIYSVRKTEKKKEIEQNSSLRFRRISFYFFWFHHDFVVILESLFCSNVFDPRI